MKIFLFCFWRNMFSNWGLHKKLEKDLKETRCRKLAFFHWIYPAVLAIERKDNSDGNG
jgi:hypothetical protein